MAPPASDHQQEFTFPFFRTLEDGVLTQISPTATEYETATFDYSGSGDVTGTAVATNDVIIPPGTEPSTSNSGCEASDSTPAPAGEPAIALTQRGTCDFAVKVDNAVAAGYDAVIIFNEGTPGAPDRRASRWHARRSQGCSGAGFEL